MSGQLGAAVSMALGWGVLWAGLRMAADRGRRATRSAERWSGWRTDLPAGHRPDKVRLIFERLLRTNKLTGCVLAVFGVVLLLFGVVDLVRVLA